MFVIIIIRSITHLGVLGLIDYADHRKHYPDHKTNLHTDQSRGEHGDQPNNTVISASTQLCRDILKLPQCPPKANNDDTGKNALLESVEVRREEEEDKKDNQGANQTGYLSEEQKQMF